MRKIVSFAVVAALAIFMAAPALAGGRPLSTTLEPSNEVPPAASDASGWARVTLNQGLGEVCVEIEAGGFEGDVLMGHIHQAPEGVNGPIVVNLGVNSADYSACVPADADLIKDIRQDPSAFYINVHTTAFPGGEIRGQLSK
jgi:hypothetical protein